MPTAKYNWEEIKQKYFESEVLEIQSFLITFLQLDPIKPLGADKKTRTKGWRIEKNLYIEQIQNKIQEKKLEHPDVDKQALVLAQSLINIEIKVASLLDDAEFSIEDLPRIKVGYDMLRLATDKSTNNLGGDKGNPYQPTPVIITFNQISSKDEPDPE